LPRKINIFLLPTFEVACFVSAEFQLFTTSTEQVNKLDKKEGKQRIYRTKGS
jgi:hypothetical protein